MTKAESNDEEEMSMIQFASEEERRVYIYF